MSDFTQSTELPQSKAVLVAIQLPGITDEQRIASLAELRRLVETLGLEPIGEVWQKRKALDNGVVVGTGKLQELAQWTGGSGIVQKGPGKEDENDEEQSTEDVEPPAIRAQVVIVDHELSPMQHRNLEKATGAQVLDRTGVIVEIFHRHASSREARLQVEIARLIYLAPRMRESSNRERQRGGIGGKGAGESAVELDRRKVRDRVAELRKELASIEDERHVRRARRQQQLRVALVGYTNAGKSSLMRALTGSEVLVADKLFATLDTTVRTLYPETTPKILVSDTVGFIKKLPHDLVASFRSTLDEAQEASLLLFVVDASDPDFRSQLAVTRSVLAEIGIDAEVKQRLILNKVDRLATEQRLALQDEFPDSLLISARDPRDVAQLRDIIISSFAEDFEELELFVPHAKQSLVGEIRSRTTVLSEEWQDGGILYQLRGPVATIAKLKRHLDLR